MVKIIIDPFLFPSRYYSISRLAGQKNIFVMSRVRTVLIHKVTITWLTSNPKVKKWIKVRNVPAPVKSTQGRRYVLEQGMYFDILQQAPHSFGLQCEALLTYIRQSFNFWRSQNLYYNGTFFPERRLSWRSAYKRIPIKVNRKQEFFLLL